MDQLWYFQDARTGDRNGPVSASTLLTLLKSEVGAGITSHGGSLCWSVSLSGWMPIMDVDIFKSTVEMYLRTYWYDDCTAVASSESADNAAPVPVPTVTLLARYRAGKLTRETSICRVGAKAWVKLGYCAELTEALDSEDSRKMSAIPTAEDLEEQQRTLQQQPSENQLADKQIAMKEAQAGDEVSDSGRGNSGEGIEGGGVLKRKRGARGRKKKKSNWIYIEGLPSGVTEEELSKHFGMVGMVAVDPLNQQPKIKIYKKEGDTTACKGDASLCYHAAASVDMALSMLDGGSLRPGCTIRVSRATFGHTSGSAATETDHDDDHDDEKEEHATQDKKERQWKLARAAGRQALSWDEDTDSRARAGDHLLCIVILEHMFEPTDFDDPRFSDELEADVASGCSPFGTIEKITFFSQHRDGVVAVKFRSAKAATDCVKRMHGRFYGGRQLCVHFWDHKTDYTQPPVEQRAAIMEQASRDDEMRHDEFGAWLEGDNDDELPEELRQRVEE